MDVSLVLGAGGVRGFAHIGVLRILEEKGFRVRAIAGSSIGGLIGAAYAIGRTPDSIEKYANSLDQATLFRSGARQRSGFQGVEGIRQAVADVFGDSTFEDLKIPFVTNAVDISTGELLVIAEGRLTEAVLATISLPGVFAPEQWNGRTVFDGGVLDPIPVTLARSLAPGLPTIAVQLTRPLAPWPRPSPIDRLMRPRWIVRLLRGTRFYRSMDLFVRSFEIINHRLIDIQLASAAPEIIIRPATNHIETLQHVEIDALIRLGEESARAPLASFLAGQPSPWPSPR